MTITFAGVPDRSATHLAAAKRMPIVPAVVTGVVLAVVIGLVSWWWLGLAIGVIVGIATFVLRPRNAAAKVLARYELRDAGPEEFPRLVNLVESVCLDSGVDEPSLHVIDDPAMNLAVVAEAGRPADLVVTTGLLDGLNRIELEAVIAAGLVRIRNNDALVGTLAATMVAGPSLRFGPTTPTKPPAFAMIRIGARADRIRRLYGDHRAMETDMSAMAVTRYPPAMASALEKMRDHGTAVSGATWGTAHLFLADPLQPAAEASDQRLNAMHSIHGEIDHRIDLLGEM